MESDRLLSFGCHASEHNKDTGNENRYGSDQRHDRWDPSCQRSQRIQKHCRQRHDANEDEENSNKFHHNDSGDVHIKILSLEKQIRFGLNILTFAVGCIVIVSFVAVFSLSSNPRYVQLNNADTMAESIMTLRSQDLVRNPLSNHVRLSSTEYHREIVDSNDDGRRDDDIEDTIHCIINVVIVYVDVDQGQHAMAKHVAQGFHDAANRLSSPINVTLLPIHDFGDDDHNHDHDDDDDNSDPTKNARMIEHADAVVLGSPVYNANVHPALQHWINKYWKLSNFWNNNKDQINDHDRLRLGGAFVTAGGMTAGAESTLQNLLHTLMTFGFMVVGGRDWTSSIGVAAVTAEEPFTVPTTTSTTETKSATTTSNSTTTKGSSTTFHFPSVCYSPTNMKDGNIHPIFLHKAYGLGNRIASITQQIWNNQCRP